VGTNKPDPRQGKAPEPSPIDARSASFAGFAWEPNRPGHADSGTPPQKAESEWNQFCNQAAGECQRVYDRLTHEPHHDDGDRQQPLKGSLGYGTFDGITYPRWHIDVAGGGRVWYYIDRTPFGSGQKRRAGRIIIDRVHMGHPEQTEKKPGGKRRPGRN